MRELNPNWINKMRESWKQEHTMDVTTEVNLAAQWIIRFLSNQGVAFRVINLGAGVKRITTDTEICPKCNGTGRV